MKKVQLVWLGIGATLLCVALALLNTFNVSLAAGDGTEYVFGSENPLMLSLAGVMVGSGGVYAGHSKPRKWANHSIGASALSVILGVISIVLVI